MGAPSNDLTAALQGLSDAQPAQPRVYRPRDVAIVLLTFSLMGTVFETQTLVAWARRLEPSTLQGVALRALEAIDLGAEAVGLDKPRRWLSDTSTTLAEGLALSPKGGWGEAEQVVEVSTAVEAPVDAPPEDALEEPAVVAPPVVAVTPSAGKELLATALLAGDSLIAGSLSVSLTNTLAKRGDLRVVRAFQIGTGLANPEAFDWAAEVPPLLAREDPQLVIISLGANDGRALRVDDRVLPFGQPEWRRVYLQRVIAFMRALAIGGARVLWVGLPPMRDKELNARARVLNQVFAEAADHVARVEYLEVAMLVSGRDQRFTTFMQTASGQPVRVRLDDGVHYAPAGSRAIARWVLDWVRERYPPRR